MSLTRKQFESACKAFIAKHGNNLSPNTSDGDKLLRPFPTGWSWREHSSYPGLGYLNRSVYLSTRRTSGPGRLDAVDDDLLESQDEAAISCAATDDLLTCQQSIVYSPTFQVPAFYFSVHRRDGVVLPLAEIISTPLFRLHALPETQTPHGISSSETSLALLSQGDHPTLGSPCWYLHPCHTAEVVGEIMREVEMDEAEHSIRWLEAWFMVLGNVIAWSEASSGA